MARHTLRRSVATAALTALAVGSLPATVAFAADSRDISDFACLPDEVPDPGFSDTSSTIHEAAIACIVFYDVAKGTSETEYSPGREVSRAQMATFIRNVLVAGGVDLPADPPNAFSDDDGSVHETSINQLAALGVVSGKTETTYAPDESVRRDQMTTFLNNAYAEITGTALTSDEDFFTDDETSTHEDNINAVAGAGIAAGTTDTTFAPGSPVRRDQMASFVARELDLLVEEGFVHVPRGSGDNTTALSVPELLRVEPVSVTQVRFVFDEALNSTVVPGAFSLYSFAAERTEASSATREGTSAVVATFTAEAVESATLAGVARSAVQDVQGNTSPEGAAPFQDVELTGGSTTAPDLLEVVPRTNAADFTFDEAAHAVSNTGYKLVLSDGTVKTATDATPVGNGTTEHTVTFELTAGEAAQVAYGYVDAGTVSDEEGDGNPLNGVEGDTNLLQTAQVSSDGATTRPDLVSVTLNADDTATFVFDEAVVRQTNEFQQATGAFQLYYLDGTVVSASSAERNSNAPNTFTATFAEGTITDLVTGASVPRNTVKGTDSEVNEPQQLGFALAFAAGETTGPDLRGATIVQRDAGGGTFNRVVRFSFDQAVGAILGQTRFLVYAADGTSKAFVASSSLPPSQSGCFIDTANPTVVECRVNDDEQQELYDFLATAVVASVERNAVEDDSTTYANGEGATIVRGTVG